MMKNINQLMKQAQEMQAKMAEMQEKMGQTVIDGTSGGGLVTVTVSGKGEMKALKIDPSLVNGEEIEVLEDLIVAAYNDARIKAETLSQEEMSKLTGGLNLPGGMKLPF
jgi:DNA-binding YbaB/EbfC family protein